VEIKEGDRIHLEWENARPAAEQAAVEAALAHPGLLETTLTRLQGDAGVHGRAARLTIRYLATGGAKRVYLITVHTQLGDAYTWVLKQFLPVKLGHLPPGTTVGGANAQSTDLDDRLLERMVWAARRLDEVAPGLCPHFGGFWQWSDGRGQTCRAMTEAYVEGHSLDHWKAILEDRFIRGDLDFVQYSAQRQALERQGIAAYMRLWVGLGCRTFTSDPSPWNVLLTPTTAGLQSSIIDLHSIHDGGTPLYVFQTLEDMFGNRDEVREHVLCPGVLDALGRTDGVRFLEAVRVALTAQGDVRERTGLSLFTASIRAISRFLAALSDRIADAPATSEQRQSSGKEQHSYAAQTCLARGGNTPTSYGDSGLCAPSPPSFCCCSSACS
jgi:hypothetical protein